MGIIYQTTVVQSDGVGKPPSAAITIPANMIWDGQPIRRIGARLRLAPEYVQGPRGKYKLEFFRLKIGSQGSWQADTGATYGGQSFESDPENTINPPPHFATRAPIDMGGRMMWAQVSATATAEPDGTVNSFPFAVDLLLLDDDSGTDFPEV